MTERDKLRITVTKLLEVARSTCERTGCPPSIMANAFVIAGLTEIVNQVGTKPAADWLRGIANQVEDDDDWRETLQ